MKVAVKDACVLMDLANAGLLDAWFGLGIETHTTDFVLRQVRQEEQWATIFPHVGGGNLKVHNLNEAELQQIVTGFRDSRLGIEDHSVLFLARKLDAILITGDRQLRIRAGALSLEVRGILWILDQLVESGQIEAGVAANKLLQMIDQGAFLPPDKVAVRLRKWRQESDYRE